MSNTDWFNPENFFQRICTEKQLGWVDFHAPSMNNPYLPPEELEFMRSNYHPKRWQKEVLAEFADNSDSMFFPRDKLLVDGQPVDYPRICDRVFVTIDTAVKMPGASRRRLLPLKAAACVCTSMAYSARIPA
jgi:hypothetical protein